MPTAFISPQALFILIMGLISAFQFFTPAYVMTNGSGGPVDSTTFYSLYLFNIAFSDFKMGYACAMAWVLMVSIIGMPLGLMMLNRLPRIATLRRPASRYRVETTGEGTLVSAAPVEQRPFVLRAIWFLLVGWWLSALCLTIAWGASVTLIGLPVAIWLYNRIPAITTLARY